MGRCNDRMELVYEERHPKVEEDAVELYKPSQSTRYFLMAIFAVMTSGPLLCMTIHQVCLSKCLILRRAPKVGSNIDDLVLLLLFIFFVLFNFFTCCIVWSLLCRACRAFVRTYLPSKGVRIRQPTLMDPKVTRSGRSYGYRTARYVNSDTFTKRRNLRSRECFPYT